MLAKYRAKFKRFKNSQYKIRLGAAVVIYELSDFHGQRRLEGRLHSVSSCSVPHGLMHGSWSMIKILFLYCNRCR